MVLFSNLLKAGKLILAANYILPGSQPGNFYAGFCSDIYNLLKINKISGKFGVYCGILIKSNNE
jgi:hypothetical protein